MGDKQFEELAHTLATETSRGQMLKSLVAVTVGGMLGFRRERGEAAPGIKAQCRSFCTETFGKNTPAARQCQREARMGMGLCYTCGPASSQGTRDICCSQDTSGNCSSYEAATCCPQNPHLSPAICVNGACVRVCAEEGACCEIDDDCCEGLDCFLPTTGSGGGVGGDPVGHAYCVNLHTCSLPGGPGGTPSPDCPFPPH